MSELLRIMVLSYDRLPETEHFLAARQVAWKVAESLEDWLVFVETVPDPPGIDGEPLAGMYGHVYETLATRKQETDA